MHMWCSEKIPSHKTRERGGGWREREIVERDRGGEGRERERRGRRLTLH